MKFKIIIVMISLIIINAVFLNINIVQAAGISDFITGGDSFISAGRGSGVSIDSNKLKSTSSTVVNILTVVGMIIAIIMAAVLGIQFMLGSVEEKAKVKDALIPFVIGCVVIFGAFGIWKIFINIMNGI